MAHISFLLQKNKIYPEKWVIKQSIFTTNITLYMLYVRIMISFLYYYHADLIKSCIYLLLMLGGDSTERAEN